MAAARPAAAPERSRTRPGPQLGRGSCERAQGGECERASYRDPADARLGQLGHRGDALEDQHVDRAVDFADHLADVFDAA